MKIASCNGGKGHDLHARDSDIEPRLDILAIKEVDRRVESLISDQQQSTQQWLLGTLVVALVMLLAAITEPIVS